MVHPRRGRGDCRRGLAAYWSQEEEMSQITADLRLMSQREFYAGRVVRKTCRIFSRNAFPFSLIGVIPWLAFLLATYWHLLPLGRVDWLMALWFGGAALLYFLLQLITVAAILPAAFQDMRGRPVRLGESIARGLRRFFPLIGGGILVSLGIVLGLVVFGFVLLVRPALILFTWWYVPGFVLLVVPGFILVTRWYVFAPVCIVEQKGALCSMKRSAELTKGNRWKLFAITIILALGGILIGELNELTSAIQMPAFAEFAVRAVFEGAWFAFSNIMSVVIYYDLRVAREGAGIESIASVFD
jgi:hypothetical protein